jgi:hypothetical protein
MNVLLGIPAEQEITPVSADRQQGLIRTKPTGTATLFPWLPFGQQGLTVIVILVLFR